MPTKLTAPRISQMMVPTVVMVWARAFCNMVQSNRNRTAAITMAPKTPTPAASVTDAMPA